MGPRARFVGSFVTMLIGVNLTVLYYITDIKFIHTPGHTVGSICVMVNTSHVHAVPGSSSNNISADDINSLATPETVLFSGDLITYSVAKGRLDGYKEYNKGQVWLQMRSMIALAGDRNSFQWLLPAHGRMVRFNDDAERSNMILEAAHALEQGGEVQNMMRVGYY
jgi:glyoxylase-like metal-dependent hydrolase (beta-lactamase superfamily II)